MTIKYVGIHSESDSKALGNLRYLVSTDTFRGRLVKYFETFEVESIDIKVPLNKQRIKEISEWDFQA